MDKEIDTKVQPAFSMPLENVIKAYRKVKQHLWKANNRLKVFAILEFENDLWDKLREIQKAIEANDEEYFTNRVGGVCFGPYTHHSIRHNDEGSVCKISSEFSNASNLKSEDYHIKTFARFSVEVEVLFALWCEVVEGDKPNRGFKQNFNKWNREVVRQCEQYLEAAKELYLFVGEIQEDFVFKDFVNLTADELCCGKSDALSKRLSTLVASTLMKWQGTAVGELKWIPRGTIIEDALADILLKKFLANIEHEVRPVHSSRCGCSLAIVTQQGPLQEGECASDRCDAFMTNVTKCFNDNSDGESIFRTEKTKILHLKGSSGKHYISSVKNHIEECIRLWHELPDCPKSNRLCEKMYVPTSRMIDAFDLHRVSQSVLSRKHFVKQIQNMESYLRDLRPCDWREQRLEFLRTIRDSFCDFNSFVIYYNLFPRVLAIAFATATNIYDEEYEIATDIVSKAISHIKKIEAEYAFVKDRIRADFFDLVAEWLLTTVDDYDKARVMCQDLTSKYPEIKDRWDVYLALAKDDSLLYADLCQTSLSETIMRIYLGKKSCKKFGAKFISPNIVSKLENDDYKFCLSLWKHVAKYCTSESEEPTYEELPSSFYFSTRAFSATEWFIYSDIGNNSHKLDVDALICRCSAQDAKISLTELLCGKADERVISVQAKKYNGKVRIGIVSWLVEMESWKAMTSDKEDPHWCDRYARLMSLVNQVIAIGDEKRPHYLILPELAIPADWFVVVAKKLAYHRVSLIAGVDYLQGAAKQVSDEVWCSLVSDLFENKNESIVVRYRKSKPALHEEYSLFYGSGTKFGDVENSCPVVIKHGDLKTEDNIRFSVLICSDLLDIKKRAELRGKVDLLVVPAWNKDTATYESLVNASAYDIHAYIALCNSREYGDSILRAPAKEPYRRDAIRIKGGDSDFFVVGTIDIRQLREFQSANRSPDKCFKPVPTGYAEDMVKDRRVLPMVEE